MALPARHGGDDLGAVADLPVAAVGGVDLGADLDHLAGDLVADRARRGEVLVSVVEDLHVRAAGRAVAHPELDLIRPAGRLLDLLESDVLGGVEAQRLHGSPPRVESGTARAYPICVDLSLFMLEKALDSGENGQI